MSHTHNYTVQTHTHTVQYTHTHTVQYTHIQYSTHTYTVQYTHIYTVQNSTTVASSKQYSFEMKYTHFHNTVHAVRRERSNACLLLLHQSGQLGDDRQQGHGITDGQAKDLRRFRYDTVNQPLNRGRGRKKVSVTAGVVSNLP